MTKLAVIAGQGRIPVQIAEKAVSMGHDVVVMPIRGQADADFSAFVSLPITLGAIGGTLALMQEQGCTHLVMGGKVVRPSLAALKPDASAVKLLGKAMMRGDDSLLRVISDFFATNGIETLAPDQFMPDRLAPAGLLAGTAPDATRKVISRWPAGCWKRLVVWMSDRRWLYRLAGCWPLRRPKGRMRCCAVPPVWLMKARVQQ